MVCGGLLIVHAVCTSLCTTQRLQCGGWDAQRHRKISRTLYFHTQPGFNCFSSVVVVVVLPYLHYCTLRNLYATGTLMPHGFPYWLTTEFNLLHNSFPLSQLAFALSIGQQCPSPPAIYKQEGGLSDRPVSLLRYKTEAILGSAYYLPSTSHCRGTVDLRQYNGPYNIPIQGYTDGTNLCLALKITYFLFNLPINSKDLTAAPNSSLPTFTSTFTSAFLSSACSGSHACSIRCMLISRARG